MTFMQLDHGVCYEAARSRDARFDGRFFIGVRTTGIYCRPICPARTPRKENVEFFSCAAAAEAAGFRACRRCRPEVAPFTPAWSGTSATIGRALALIDDGVLDEGGDIEALSSRLGVGSRHLRRLFIKYLGVAPHAIATSRRTHLARVMLDRTLLPISEIALAAGFGSVRRFNDAMKATFGAPPTELRRRNQSDGSSVEVRLAYRTPFDWDALSGFLSRRAVNGVESLSEGVYTRRDIRIMNDDAGRTLVVSMPAALARDIRDIATRARHLFDTDADPHAIAGHLRGDRLLRPIIRQHGGIRVPGAWDAFEIAVRAIVGQQVSVAGATTTLRKLVDHFGAFPTAQQLATETIGGMPKERAATIKRLASAVVAGDVMLERGASLEDSLVRLTAIKGIGPWTANYIAMRALREPDAFPAGDLVLQRAAGVSSEKELLRMAEAWRPWRAYATMLLWSR
jgi:AraC family transcriptional regulator, regulatory protein of adaptative response / DNA-3-methyladenine glycosylase II